MSFNARYSRFDHFTAASTTTGLDLACLTRATRGLDVDAFIERVGSLFFAYCPDGHAALPLRQTDERRPTTPGQGVECRVLPIRSREGTLVITVGRLDGNDICVPDRTVSRYHGFVREIDGRFFIRDAGSTNGTAVDEHVVRPHGAPVELSSGCVVRLGSVKLHTIDARALLDFARHYVH